MSLTAAKGPLISRELVRDLFELDPCFDKGACKRARLFLGAALEAVNDQA
jgi:hypothetical protein